MLIAELFVRHTPLLFFQLFFADSLKTFLLDFRLHYFQVFGIYFLPFKVRFVLFRILFPILVLSSFLFRRLCAMLIDLVLLELVLFYVLKCLPNLHKANCIAVWSVWMVDFCQPNELFVALLDTIILLAVQDGECVLELLKRDVLFESVSGDKLPSVSEQLSPD